MALRGGRRRRGPPLAQAFELLALLVERRPNPVSKADIHLRLWPDTFVTDSSLPSLMSEVRDAVADHQREPRLLRTLHGFGYAFQALGEARQSGAHAVRSSTSPSSTFICSRIRYFWTLPVTVSGNASTSFT